MLSLNELSLYLGLLSSVAGIFQVLHTIFGNKTNNENEKWNKKSIEIAQGVLWFGAFVIALPTLLSILSFRQSDPQHLTSSYNFSSNDWLRIAWTAFLIVTAGWLNKFKD